jgi:hypothetical protein
MIVGLAVQIQGIRRLKHEPDNGVWITDGVLGVEISELQYRQKGYSPPVEALPWSPQAHRPLDRQK